MESNSQQAIQLSENKITEKTEYQESDTTSTKNSSPQFWVLFGKDWRAWGLLFLYIEGLTVSGIGSSCLRNALGVCGTFTLSMFLLLLGIASILLGLILHLIREFVDKDEYGALKLRVKKSKEKKEKKKYFCRRTRRRLVQNPQLLPLDIPEEFKIPTLNILQIQHAEASGIRNKEEEEESTRNKSVQERSEFSLNMNEN